MHRVRLYPSSRQAARLAFALDVTRQLYNAALQQRRDLWTMRRIAITSKSQYAEITALRKEDACIAAVYRECLDAALHRLDLDFAAFFRRVRSGATPGYPRFRAAARWRQLEFPHGDRALRHSKRQDRIRIPMIGSVRLRKGRAIPPFGRAFVVERTAAGTRFSSATVSLRPCPRQGVRLGSIGVSGLSSQPRTASG